LLILDRGLSAGSKSLIGVWFLPACVFEIVDLPDLPRWSFFEGATPAKLRAMGVRCAAGTARCIVKMR
jgi:hypothetical protein